jgi:predicted nucleic acid-binding protein
MMVADSSYLVEAILRNASLLEGNTFIAPDLALYEIPNTIWKHQVIFADLKEPSPFFDLFFQLLESETIQLVRPDERLLKRAYALSVKHRSPLYDTVFISLAIDLSLELKTFDDNQKRILSKEKGDSAPARED